jgi:hypothetical protein
MPRKAVDAVGVKKSNIELENSLEQLRGTHPTLPTRLGLDELDDLADETTLLQFRPIAQLRECDAARVVDGVLDPNAPDEVRDDTARESLQLFRRDDRIRDWQAPAPQLGHRGAECGHGIGEIERFVGRIDVAVEEHRALLQNEDPRAKVIHGACSTNLVGDVLSGPRLPLLVYLVGSREDDDRDRQPEVGLDLLLRVECAGG